MHPYLSIQQPDTDTATNSNTCFSLSSSPEPSSSFAMRFGHRGWRSPNGAPFPWSYWRTGGKLWGGQLEIAVFVEDDHVGKVGATPEKSGWSGFLWLLVLFFGTTKSWTSGFGLFGFRSCRFGPYRRSWKRNKVCLKTRMGIRRFEGRCWPVNGVMYWFKPVSFLAGNGEWFGIPCSTGEVKTMNLRTYNFWDKKIEGDLLW